MIKTPNQLSVAKRRVAEFEDAIEKAAAKAMPAGVAPVVWKAHLDSMKGTMNSILCEIDEYMRLVHGDQTAVKLACIADLPTAIIQTRILRGLTQSQFAIELGVKPQQVQRWESSDNESVSFDVLVQMARVLGIQMVDRRSHDRAVSTRTNTTRVVLVGGQFEGLFTNQSNLEAATSGSPFLGVTREPNRKSPWSSVS